MVNISKNINIKALLHSAGDLQGSPVPLKQHLRTWINKSIESAKNDNITTKRNNKAWWNRTHNLFVTYYVDVLVQNQ